MGEKHNERPLCFFRAVDAIGGGAIVRIAPLATWLPYINITCYRFQQFSNFNTKKIINQYNFHTTTRCLLALKTEYYGN